MHESDAKNPIRVSIALCTFNGGRFLDVQLQSLLDQTRPPDEIVISDDNSTDNTLAVVERFAAENPGLFVVRKNQTGLGCDDNFFAAFATCRGEIIFPCDQDDRWKPEKIERILAAFDAEPSLVGLIADAELADERLNSTGQSPRPVFSPRRQQLIRDGHSFELLLERSFALGACMAFRRACLPLIVPRPHMFPYDTWLSLALAATGPVKITSDQFNIWRRHPSQVTHAASGRFARVKRLLRLQRTVAAADDRLERSHALLEWMLRHESALLPGTLGQARRFAGFVDRRATLRRAGPFRKGFIALKLLLAGQYHRFATGFKSFLLDAL